MLIPPISCKANGDIMKALTLISEGHAKITDVAEPSIKPGNILLKVEMVSLCGTDLNSFRGRNPLVTYPRDPRTRNSRNSDRGWLICCFGDAGYRLPIHQLRVVFIVQARP